ncbi:hypothetical protein E2C01_047984 [Portunus trituberculatus]|uniref:Uncharacterized protein n=1 Tax=Portunus trituberculatus TaxID=210409 RepID=A0A5B7G976_PORTR|nr:hypothetical protein [Portunus trituberculatus]
MERRSAKEAKGQQGAHDSLLTDNDRLNREVCLLREASKPSAPGNYSPVAVEDREKGGLAVCT